MSRSILLTAVDRGHMNERIQQDIQTLLNELHATNLDRDNDMDICKHLIFKECSFVHGSPRLKFASKS